MNVGCFPVLLINTAFPREEMQCCISSTQMDSNSQPKSNLRTLGKKVSGSFLDQETNSVEPIYGNSAVVKLLAERRMKAPSGACECTPSHSSQTCSPASVPKPCSPDQASNPEVLQRKFCDFSTGSHCNF